MSWERLKQLTIRLIIPLKVISNSNETSQDKQDLKTENIKSEYCVSVKGVAQYNEIDGVEAG